MQDTVLKEAERRREPVLIAGPTASGKSRLALSIAGRIGGCVINADALQSYDCWRALTARPDEQDEAARPHALYGHLPGTTPHSAGDWLRDVGAVLEECRARDLVPVIVGGTGLYFAALTEGLAEIPPIPPEVRRRADERRAEGGAEALATDLAQVDPQTLARLDRANPARLQRAWEVRMATGRGLSEWQADPATPLLPLAQCTALLVEAPVDWLATRIAARWETMLEEGALAEVRAARTALPPDAPAWKAIGARELAAHLDGAITRDEATRRAVIATRQYAKRQRTWFRARMEAWHKMLSTEISHP